MIKTVKGVTAKLTTARDMGYKYCKVAVDNNNIGCALIKDILDSINYCNTPGGKIRTFIHRGYEYAVDEGIEITILTDEEFLEHYIGMPCNKDLLAKEEDRRRRDALENATREREERVTEEKSKHLNEMVETMNASLNSLKAKISPSPNPSRNLFADGTDGDDDEPIGFRKPQTEQVKEGFFGRFKKWLKGDVRYKR